MQVSDQPGRENLRPEGIALRKISKIDQRKIARAAKARRRKLLGRAMACSL